MGPADVKNDPICWIGGPTMGPKWSFLTPFVAPLWAPLLLIPRGVRYRLVIPVLDLGVTPRAAQTPATHALAAGVVNTSGDRIATAKDEAA
jgi:hypothetical protein